MSIRIQWSMTQNAWDKRVCEDYWAYDHKISYVDYIRLLCQKYNISSHLLFETISQCYACLDDVCCEYCGSACPIEVPADIAYMQAKESWFCAVCEHAMWRSDFVGKYFFHVYLSINKVIMPFTNKYALIESFSEGMAPIMSKSGKWGFINTEGKEVIAPQYDGTDGNFGGYYGFSEGLAGMQKGNKWGYITKTGKVAVPFIYDEIRPFSEGLAGVLKGDKWGFIDGTNKTMIPFKYSDSNVERYSVNYMGASYFIFEDGIAEIATVNQELVCISKADKKMSCR